MSMNSDSMILSSIMYFSYSQFLVFDTSRAARPGLDWTQEHFNQGFARQEDNVSFRTLLEFGHAELSIHLGPYEPRGEHERVIEVPLEVPSGEVVIAGPEEFEDTRTLKMPPGHYRLVAAQTALDEDRQVVDLFFEKVNEQLSRSRLILADRELRPSGELLESAELA